jgi:hypothetical protein
MRDCILVEKNGKWKCINKGCGYAGRKTGDTPPRRNCDADKETKLLGDHIETALKKIGVTPERVERLIKRKCRCRKRKELLNRLDIWARKKLAKLRE